MRQVTFSSAQSQPQIKRKQKKNDREPLACRVGWLLETLGAWQSATI